MRLDARPSALFVFGLLAALKAAALVGIAQAVATGIVSVIAGTDAWHGALALGIGSGALRAVVMWAVPVFATVSRDECLGAVDFSDVVALMLAAIEAPAAGAKPAPTAAATAASI